MIVIGTACMLLVPLEPLPLMINLGDPLVESLIYSGRQNTKDLFFSGHTATIALFGFVFPRGVLRRRYLSAAATIGVLLAQHAHFSIDVLGAPVAAYAAARIQQRLTRLAAGAGCGASPRATNTPAPNIGATTAGQARADAVRRARIRRPRCPAPANLFPAAGV